MERLPIQSDLFEDSEEFSAPLFTCNTRPLLARPAYVFVTIGSEKCFKILENRFFEGLGNMRLSEMTDEIRGTGVFKNLV